MRNKYEFNIEDINSVIITDLTDAFKISTNCIRKKNDDGTPSRMFVEKYSAEEDYSEDGIIGVICSRCGTWNYYDEASYEFFKENDFKHACPACKPEDETSYDENDLIDLIQSFINEESFNDVLIFINGTHIQ